MLDNFKMGWKNIFEKRLTYIKTVFGNNVVIKPTRYKGMLRIHFEVDDENTQYILNCVSHKMERESAKICENCGKHGIRRSDLLDETMCLCLHCYVMIVDNILSQQ